MYVRPSVPQTGLYSDVTGQRRMQANTAGDRVVEGPAVVVVEVVVDSHVPN